MKIIIIGAGELGQLLAERLSSARNDVTIIDVSKEGFARIHEKLDVMTLAGDATNVKSWRRQESRRRTCCSPSLATRPPTFWRA